MTEILFITGNKGKVMSLQNRLPEGYLVKQLDIDLPEIQHPDVEEIAKEKARIAYAKVGKALVVQDSAFHIEALSGFPGPYIKYVNDTIGAAGIIKLMDGIENRKAGFKMTLAFADDQGKITVFTNDLNKGTIALQVTQVDSEKAWSELWKIYIPKDAKGKTLAELSQEKIDRDEKRKDKTSEFAKFVKWLVEK